MLLGLDPGSWARPEIKKVRGCGKGHKLFKLGYQACREGPCKPGSTEMETDLSQTLISSDIKFPGQQGEGRFFRISCGNKIDLMRGIETDSPTIVHKMHRGKSKNKRALHLFYNIVGGHKNYFAHWKREGCLFPPTKSNFGRII